MESNVKPANIASMPATSQVGVAATMRPSVLSAQPSTLLSVAFSHRGGANGHKTEKPPTSIGGHISEFESQIL